MAEIGTSRLQCLARYKCTLATQVLICTQIDQSKPMTTTNDDKDWGMENNERLGRHLKVQRKVSETCDTKKPSSKSAINLKQELSKVHSEE